jgi:hypothetical protein
MEFYSATKNEILSLTSKWMEMENIILNEVSQAQKAKNHIFAHMQIVDLKYAVLLLDMGRTLG